jgi:peptide/nickel transport system permease protein
MEQVVELEKDKIEKLEKEASISKHVVSWIFRNLKFVLIPASRLEDLTQRQFEYEKTLSKRKFIRRLKSVLTITGIIIIITVITIAVFPHWLTLYPFDHIAFGHHDDWWTWTPGDPANPLGRGHWGQDIYSRMIFGARSSLTIALPSILLSVIGGIILGIIAAYYRGWVDSIIMRISDIFLAFPGLVLALVMIAIFGRHLENIMLVYGILGIPYYARLIRGNVLQARELPYVQAARVAGAGNLRIMFRHILPNVFQPVMISFTFDIGGVILGLAGLAFLGFYDPAMVEWGRDISMAQNHLHSTPWGAFAPGIMILITVLGFMLVGDGLRDALDPRLKNL